MPITAVQQGVIGQFLAAVLMMLGSDGLLSPVALAVQIERFQRSEMALTAAAAVVLAGRAHAAAA